MSDANSELEEDVRRLLHSAAASPVDDFRLPASTRRQRMSGRVIAAVVAALIVIASAISVAALLPGSDDGRSAEEQPSQRLATGPPGWLLFEDAASGVSLRYPPTWNIARESLTPHLSDPKEIVSLGTGGLTYVEGECAHIPSSALEDVGPTDAFVSLLVRKEGTPPDVDSRPKAFSAESGVDGSETEVVPCSNDLGDTRVRWVPFADQGRVFYAIVAIGAAASPEREAEPWQILNSLTVRSDAQPDTTTSDTATATTTPPSTNSGVPTDTSAPGGEEAAIREAFLGWLNSEGPVDAAAPFVEDFQGIRDSLAQAQDRAPPPLADYHGRVEQVIVISEDDARVVFSILQGDSTLLPNHQGAAIKVDGTWKVTRETVCGVLELGGTPCPPRS